MLGQFKVLFDFKLLDFVLRVLVATRYYLFPQTSLKATICSNLSNFRNFKLQHYLKDLISFSFDLLAIEMEPLISQTDR